MDTIEVRAPIADLDDVLEESVQVPSDLSDRLAVLIAYGMCWEWGWMPCDFFPLVITRESAGITRTLGGEEDV